MKKAYAYRVFPQTTALTPHPTPHPTQMMSIPCVRQRIEAGRLYKTISDDLAALESAAGTLHTALGQLRGSITLAAIQQVVLVMGNFLNQGSKSGDCVGFKVESLLRLKDTKSPCKRSKTLLHAVAQEVLGWWWCMRGVVYIQTAHLVYSRALLTFPSSHTLLTHPGV